MINYYNKLGTWTYLYAYVSHEDIPFWSPKSMGNPQANQQIFQQHYIIGFQCCLNDNYAFNVSSTYNFRYQGWQFSNL